MTEKTTCCKCGKELYTIDGNDGNAFCGPCLRESIFDDVEDSQEAPEVPVEPG